jgi:hypothetical protein
MLLPQIGAFGNPLFQEGDGLRFGLGHADLAFAYTLGQPRAAMGAGIPLVHARQHFVTVVDGDHRPFGQRVQLAVGDDGGHLDDDVVVRIQAGHFQIDPDQVLWVLHEGLLV